MSLAMRAVFAVGVSVTVPNTSVLGFTCEDAFRPRWGSNVVHASMLFHDLLTLFLYFLTLQDRGLVQGS